MRKRTSPYYTMLGCFRLTMTNLRIIGQWFRPLSLTSKSPRTTLIFNPHYSVVLLRPGSLRTPISYLYVNRRSTYIDLKCLAFPDLSP